MQISRHFLRDFTNFFFFFSNSGSLTPCRRAAFQLLYYCDSLLYLCVADHAPCLSFRRRAARAQYSGNVFMPQCQSDGSYEPLQCHDKLGYCWCVTPQGRPLPHLAVTAVGATGKKPNCTRPAKTRRGSGPRGSAGRHGGGRGPWQHSARGRRRRCGGRARADFKHNLISIFRSEFRRAALASGESRRPAPPPAALTPC